MRTQVVLKCAAFDSQLLAPGTSSLTFFQDDSSQQAVSVAGVAERELVKWLMANATYRGLVFDALAIPVTCEPFLQVVQPFIVNPNAKPGDIDLLASEVSRPKETVIVEWKRVKVIAAEHGEDHVNKIEGLANARAQVRALAKLGFHRTFLGIAAAVDGRKRLGSNFLSRGTSDETFKRTLAFADGLNLPEQVGVLYVELSQPVSKEIDHAAMVCAAIVKPAMPCMQTHDLTMLVDHFVRHARSLRTGGRA